MKLIKPLLSSILFLSTLIQANELDDLLEEAAPQEKALSTFKGTEIIGYPTIETAGESTLSFKISHRFGQLSQGLEGFYGLDQANILLELQYGLSSWIDLGLSRSSGNSKPISLFTKAKLLEQSSDKSTPLSITLLSEATLATNKNYDPNYDLTLERRFSHLHSLLIAHRFNSDFSLQLGNHFLHRLLTETTDDKNMLFTHSIGARYKWTSRVASTIESGLPLPYSENHYLYTFPWAIGIDIETGGHVFQLHFSNSSQISLGNYIAQTRSYDDFLDQIYFGFRISRAYAF